MVAPTIQTARLVMRAHRVDDFAASAAMWSDPEVVRYISGRPSTIEQSWSRLLRYAGQWSLLGFGYWVVEERATGAFVGEVGLADYHREIEPSLAGMPELGWVLASAAHGKGYATEAVRACVAWAGEHFPSGTRLACMIAPENTASVRVAEKCGLRFEQTATYLGQPALLFVRNAVG